MINPLILDFAGEIHRIEPGGEFTIGRQGDLALDDNPYLHRNFILLRSGEGMWWVHNVGSRLSANLSDGHGLVRSWIAPGARLPLVFPVMTLTFAAGPTAYEIRLACELDGFVPVEHRQNVSGETTAGATIFTKSQFLLILALAEPVLRRVGSGSSRVPASADAAARLGWTITRFNRKLDNVCDKLTAAGVKGLRGGTTGAASSRRATLVEYAVSTLLVTREDLGQLDEERAANLGGVRRDDGGGDE